MELQKNIDQYYQLAYGELKALAQSRLKHERAAHTLSTTDLVHEVYLKLARQDQQFVNQQQFMALASQAMRRILVDYARERKRQKRGGDRLSVTFNEELHDFSTTADEVLALDEALQRYQGLSARGAQIVEYWFFAGYKRAEIAQLLDISTATVGREWQLARLWLNREIRKTKQYL